MYGGLDSFTVMAIPFFVLTGIIMERGGIARRIIDFSVALVGWITGSLLLVATVAGIGMAAVSGSGAASTAAISSIMLREMRRRGYDIDFSAGLMAAAGTLVGLLRLDYERVPQVAMLGIAFFQQQELAVLPVAGAFARLMLRIVPEPEGGYTTRLDRSLLQEPALALDAVAALARDLDATFSVAADGGERILLAGDEVTGAIELRDPVDPWTVGRRAREALGPDRGAIEVAGSVFASPGDEEPPRRFVGSLITTFDRNGNLIYNRRSV